MCLIAAMDLAAIGNLLLVILMVAAGLGAVIFVHELGHFAVAKMCGVKCPKFYIGFDVPLGAMINNMLGREGEFKIFGIGIPRTIGPPITIGETEYGIGILPLGGYVRMLGQDDDPSNINEQLRESQVAGNSPDSKTIVGPDGKSYVVDRRSYLAKSVPQRMAIISAGVIMNIIFAFIFATVAFKIGVPYTPTVVSRTAPGSPAWQAAIMPGDEVVQIEDIKNPSFEELLSSVTLGDLKNGVPFVIARDGKTIDIQLKPEQGAKLARVGLASGGSLQLPAKLKWLDHSAAAQATPAFKAEDEVVAVNGQPVKSYAEYDSIVLKEADKPITLTVLRGAKRPVDQPEAAPTGGERIDIVVPAQKERTTGLVMQMGKIVAVQKDSPAAAAGLKPGDFIERIVAEGSDADAKSLTRDPLALPEALRLLAEEGQEVRLTVRRGGEGEEGRQATEDLVIPLRQVDWIEEPIADNDPLSAPALGLAYRVMNIVSEVKPGSPAEKAGLREDDELLTAEFIFPADMPEKPKQKTFELYQENQKDGISLPIVLSSLQQLPPATELKLSYKRGDEVVETTLTPVESDSTYVVERGIGFQNLRRIRTAETWGEAASRGFQETKRSLLMVYTFLSKLGSQVSVTMLGGPLTIAQAAGHHAFEGIGKLLIFLTMLSANLAVINFLPIPMLDGGHMVFLAWEGLRGRPASERVVMTMQTAGFVFLISLMLFVFTLDLTRLFSA